VIYKVVFTDGHSVDVDVVEFGADSMGAVMDHLAKKHGGVARIDPISTL